VSDLQKLGIMVAYSQYLTLFFLNIALFGTTAKQWQEKNPKLTGNLRDYVSVEQLVVLANLENLNAEFIKQNLEAEDRLKRLNKIAIEQLELLLNNSNKGLKQ